MFTLREGRLKAALAQSFLPPSGYSGRFTGGVMQSIHGHEVLQMMIASGEPYSTASLRRQSSRASAQMHVFIPARQKI
jgi:hypothetical protein